MRLDYLRYFDRLAEVLSYTRAAEDLYIAQPTLSVAIKRMEQELGFALFRRKEGSSKVELTEAGEAFHEHVSRALKNIDAGLRVAREIQGEINSSLRIGTLYAIQGRFWSQAMQGFQDSSSSSPLITIEQAYSATLIERLRKGGLDVVFASRTPEDDDLDRVLVWSQPLVLAVNKDNPLARRSKVGIDDLKGRRILTYSTSSPVAPSMDASLPIEDLDLVRSYDDEITLSSLVSSNRNALALFCYSFLVNAFHDVACLSVEGVPSDFHKVYLFSRRESHPKVVADFIDFMGAYRFPSILETGASLAREASHRGSYDGKRC